MQNSLSLPSYSTALDEPQSFIERWSTSFVFVLMSIPVLGAFFFIGQSLRLDESQSLWQVSRSLSGILTLVAGDVHVPLYHVLLHYWRMAFGESVTIARLFSLFFFVLSVPALYLLGSRAYNKRTGLLVAFLFAISPFMNWYASEIRMYTLFVFLTIMSQYFFIRIMQEERPRLATWASYTLIAILGVFTHYFFFLSLIAQAVYFFLRHRIFPKYTLRLFIGSGIVVALAIAPWVWYVLFRGVVGFQEPSLVAPSFVDLFSTFSQFLFGFQSDALNTIFLSLWPIAVILGLVALRRSVRFLPQTEYFIVSILLSFGLTFFGSHLFAPIFVSRYLIFTIPAFYLIVASLFSTYTKGFRRVIQGALVTLMLVTFGIQVTSPNTPVKEEYRGATEYLSMHATAQDAIIVSAPFTIYPVQYYYRGPSPIKTLPEWDQYAYGPIPTFNHAALPDMVAKTTADYQNVYLVLSYNQGYEADIKQYFDSHYERLNARTFSNDLSVYVYRLRYNTVLSAIPTAVTRTN
ncbi:MAG: rane protein-like protein [Parcubacteria group bacterium]|nr:rane protein-like protein [Parcubacteria group bacterium]